VKRIYLDHAATTPMKSGVLDAMLPWLADRVAANASSVHRSGQRARAAVEEARERLAQAIHGAPGEIVFTSGATEADALGLLGPLAALERSESPRRALVVNAAEHAAILEPAKREAHAGRHVHWLPPGREGAPSAETLEAALTAMEEPPALVAVMHTNNETGALADVTALAEVAHDHGALFLCDAVQAFGYAPLDVTTLGADLVSLSAHKVGGPQGIGALWVRDGVPLDGLTIGGGQERGKRAGTHATASIVGFGVAAEHAAQGVASRAARTAAVRDHLERALLALPGVHGNATGPRGPKHLNVRIDDVEGEALLIALDDAGVEVSAGSACSAGSVEPSHVLLAMGFDKREARSSLRFSVHEETSFEMIDETVERFERVLGHLRNVQR